ncbi:metal ABC transporter solute-binding protein, Zn/Mn family [Nitrobacter winogradskyi]|uniref:metal ABC transporter solute-binding protein, Zn/Mn family n=1 Tax=Nitrobacter winogradskyi TaxID=913 RepID=UPI00059C35B5|nr:zinc ABC transporter substrate-binding protein [Nitrobacter winogradskyi]
MVRYGSVIWVIAILLAALAPASAQETAEDRADERIVVVASFSILGDFAQAVGGARTDVTTLVGTDGDAHVFTPTPADARKVAAARLVIVNGLGLEGWLPRLVQASGGHAAIVVAATGVPLRGAEAGQTLRGEDSADPHAWQSVANAKIYVANIRDALIAADPAGEAVYRGNAADYLAKLDALDREVREGVARIPPERRKVISTHDAFGYFEAAYGIAFIAPQGVSTDSEASARDIAATITQIRTAKIPAVFLEDLGDPRLIRQIATEAGARVGGTLYSDSLSDEKGDAPTYIAMVRHNIKALTSALAE